MLSSYIDRTTVRHKFSLTYVPKIKNVIGYVIGYKSEYFQNHFFKAAVECAMCNRTGKITEKQFGGKRVAEQSRARSWSWW